MRMRLQVDARDGHITLMLFYSCHSLSPKVFFEAVFSL